MAPTNRSERRRLARKHKSRDSRKHKPRCMLCHGEKLLGKRPVDEVRRGD